jgi:exodeoxyribonuclease VII small subunit
MSDEIPLDSSSFNKNYQVLKQTADWLSTQREPDIDQLVPKVEKAMKAYQICKDRLTKVQETLGRYFEKSGSSDEVGATDNEDGLPRKPVRPRPSADGDGGNTPF